MATNRTKVGRERITVVTKTRAERDLIRSAAQQAGLDMSSYLLRAGLHWAEAGAPSGAWYAAAQAQLLELVTAMHVRRLDWAQVTARLRAILVGIEE